MKFKLILRYDGTDYAGYQKQINAKAVQNVFDNALSEVFGESVVSVPSGRTDQGVHANGQVVHFERESEIIPCQKLPFLINKQLPDDIEVLFVEKAEDDFHARYSARVRHYRYILNKHPPNDSDGGIEWYRYSYFPGFEPEMEKLISLLSPLEGVHDFTTFSSKHDVSESKVRELFKIAIFENKDKIYLDFFGNSFLRNMIRSLVGNALQASRKGEVDDFLFEILQKRDESFAKLRAPGKGLFLQKVYYEELYGPRDYYSKPPNKKK